MTQYKGTTHNGEWDSWYGPSGREGPYNHSLIRNSLVADSLQEIGIPLVDDAKITSLRKSTEITCAYKNGAEPETPCEIKNSVCLFNIKEDPCEV